MCESCNLFQKSYNNFVCYRVYFCVIKTFANKVEAVTDGAQILVETYPCNQKHL